MSGKAAGSGKAAPRRRAKSRGGALLCIALLMGGSSVLRLSDGAGMALARELGALGASAEGERSGAPVAAADEEAALILAALDERERKLQKREAEMAARADALTAVEAEIEAGMAALVTAEDQLSQTMALAETAAEDDIGTLTAVYESMKPKDAAALFAQMDPSFAAGFLGRMRAEAAAEVMARLAPEIAYSISVVMAGRNAGTPRE